MSDWMARYVGVPFVDGGRDFKGWDCWGLVRAALLNERGVEVPSYGDIAADDLLKVARQIEHDTLVAKAPWIEVLRPVVRAFDVAVMYRRRYPTHVGLMIDDHRLLHVVENHQTLVLPLASPFFTLHARTKFYRHEALAR